MKTFVKLAFLFAISIFISSCSSSKPAKQGRQGKIKSYDIASGTTRDDLVGQSIIILSGYSYTMDYVNSSSNHGALQTHWRYSRQEFKTEDASSEIQLRDRAVIHLTARTVQGREKVKSRITFELNMRASGDDKWTRITPGSEFENEYLQIVDQIQGRLRRLGYIFN